jgi:hypothetical protein
MTQTVDIDYPRVLRNAANLVELGWVRGNMAVNGLGDATLVSDPLACAFCAHGALLAAAIRAYPDRDIFFLESEIEGINEAIIDLGLFGETGKLVTSYGANGVVHQWNDEAFRTKADVMETLRKAADRIEADSYELRRHD